jgi:esterase/lipase
MKKVYFISGLGADKTIFQNLELPDIEQIHVDWIKPLQNESFESYAKRLSEVITEPNPIIVGLSFGGMMAIEISKLLPTQKTILISSAKGRNEIPPYFRILKFVPFHKFISSKQTALNTSLLKYFFGVSTNEEINLLKTIIHNSDEKFDAWAVDKIVNWNNVQLPPNVVHIHGTADNLLPYKYVKADYTIKDGTHLMVLTKAKEVSALLNNLLN